MLGFGLQILLQPPDLWQLAREIQPPAMVYFQPGESKDVPIRPELTIGRQYYADQGPCLEHDPVAFGQRLAHDAIASARTNGIEYWVGPTEPPVASPDDCARLVACEEARAEILNAHGLKAVVFYLSVGWPLEDVNTHKLLTGHFDTFLRQLPSQNLVGLNEYFYPTGPLHPDSYDPYRPSRIWRFKHWPGIDRHKIVITECGMDIGGNKKTDGWKKQCPVGMSLESWFDVYVEWMGEYLALISQDDRVIGAAWFCGGPGYGWGDYDMLSHWRQARELLCGPVPDIPPAMPPLPPEPTIRVRLTDGKVIVLPVEEYLRGVVPAEVFPSWPMEALQGQAVLARSVAMARIADPRDQASDINRFDQVYDPAKFSDRTDVAIASTAGVYLMQNGQPWYAFYVSDCGLERCKSCQGAPGFIPPNGTNPSGVWPNRACQWGMKALADCGYGWRDISLWYYPDQGVYLSDGEGL